jgi:hypothetical protein
VLSRGQGFGAIPEGNYHPLVQRKPYIEKSL